MQRLLIVAEGIDEDARAELKALIRACDSIDTVDEVGPDPRNARIDPITMMIVAGGIILGTGVLTRVADWWRDRSDSLLVIDARGDDLKIESRPDLRGYRGRTIIVTDHDTQVTIDRERGAFTMDEIINAVKAGVPASDLPRTLPQGEDSIIVEPFDIPNQL